MRPREQIHLQPRESSLASRLIAAWDSGDGVTRREPLATLFSDIHVSQGRVVGYTPRPDRQAQVTRLMEAISWKVPVRVGRSFRNANPIQVVRPTLAI